MEEDPPQTLSIRCPNCGQRFKVGHELAGRVVECGSCDHRFRVDEESIHRPKKQYPGERKDAQLDRFSRIPKEIAPIPPKFQQVHYAPGAAPSFEGESPLGLLAGSMAIITVLVLLSLILFCNEPGDVFDGTSTSRQIGIAFFGGVVASVLIFLANLKRRKRATILSTLSLVLLICAASFVKKTPPLVKGAKHGEQPHVTSGDAVNDLIQDASGKKSAPQSLEELRADLKIEPLDQEIIRVAASGTHAKVLGVYVDDLKDYDKLLVRDYLVRVTQSDPNTHPYTRTNAYLYVLSDVKTDLQTLAKFCERFAEVEIILEPLNLVRVKLKPDALTEGPMEKLSDLKSDEFYDLNRRELECIDLGRCHRAIRRLASVEPKLFRTDIVRRLQQLLKEGQRDMQSDIAECLDIWAVSGDGTDEAIHQAVDRLEKKQITLPKSMIAYMVHRKDAHVLPILHRLWMESPVDWESLYQEMGSSICTDILRSYETLNISQKYSAINLFTSIGTPEAIPVLTKDRPNLSQELQSMIDTAIKQIKSRQ
jgi:predicted Zn finger-like uncharacterized protein